MKKLFVALFFLIAVPAAASAQCNGVYNAGTLCGANTTGPPTAIHGAATFANDFGAKCDGSTDDHVAFQNAINSGITNDMPVRFIGPCAIASPGLTISTGAIDFGSVNFSNNFLLATGSGYNLLTVNQDTPVFLHDFTATYTGTIATPDTAIVITSTAGGHTFNASSQIFRVSAAGFNGINFANAGNWVLRDSIINAVGGDGLQTANTFNGDDGSDIAYANQIGSSASGGNAIHWKSGGGIKFISNVIIGTAFNAGFLIDLATGLATSDIWFTNNHVEGLATTGAAAVQMQRNGNTATLGNVIITNNELAGADVAVYEVLDGTGQWLNNVTIGDNVMGTSGNAAAVNYCIELLTPITGISIHHGSCNGVSGVANNNVVVKLGTQTATNCAVGPIPHQGGSFAASTLSSCTSYTPD